MSAPKYLFVYGTLRRDHVPAEMADLMQRLDFIGEGSLPGRVIDLGSYPGAVFDESSRSKVEGEIYKLPPNSHVLRKLDIYEEFRPSRPRHSLFIREPVFVRTSDGKNLSCWAYRFNTEKLKKRRVSRKQPRKTSRVASTRASR